MVEAVKLWTSAPYGPNVHDLFMRLRTEAIERGELNAVRDQ